MLSMFPAALSLLGDQVSGMKWFPESASTFAESNDSMYYYITSICVIFFVPIGICLFYFAWRYHKPKGSPAESQVSHNTPLELAWSILPSLLLIWMFYAGARGYLDQRVAPDGAFELKVDAQKWFWVIDYGRGTYNPEMHILLNEPAKFTMTSKDVIHSLYVPAFRVKKDVVPGRYNYMWFQPTVASEKVSDKELEQAKTWNKGKAWDYDHHQFTPDGYRFFDLYCAEYCGKDHSMMQTQVVVHKTREDLDAWIKKYSTRGEVTMEDWGERLYQQRGCKGCHSIDGTSGTGPSYKDGFGAVRELQGGGTVLFDENYTRESILNPKAKIAKGYQPVMPSYKGQLSDDDIDSLIAYLKTLSKNVKPEPVETAGADGAQQASVENADAEKAEPAVSSDN